MAATPIAPQPAPAGITIDPMSDNAFYHNKDPSTTDHSHHHHQHHHTHHHKSTAGNAISKLVGRLRTGSTDSSTSSLPSTASAAATPAPTTVTPYDSSESDGSRSSSISRLRNPSFKLLPQSKSRTFSPSASGSHHQQQQARDAPLSLDLWNEAYDALRDNPRSAGLVVAYEGIITQELPDNLKLGGLNMTLRDHPDRRRLELVTAIAEAGLKRRRNSKSSQVGDEARAVVNATKDAVELALQAYPSAALAWCGLCTLTPLLLDAVMRRPDMRTGLLHVTGRISWYTHLARLVQRDAWHDEGQYRRRQQQNAGAICSPASARETLEKLYRKVLEFEMVCVCAAASTWNPAAKNVVDWQALGALTGAIGELDEELRDVVDSSAVVGTVREKLLGDYRDLEIGDGETSVPLDE